jgi:uncharacterized membrane protein
MLQNLTLSGLNWLWPVAAVVGFALALLIWNYRSAPSGLVRWLCPLLKALGIAALAFCLLDPLSSGQRARPGANLFAILADNSHSLQIKDLGSSSTRADLLAGLLSPQHALWQTSLEENFDLRRYYFDSRLEATKDFTELKFDGRSSGMGSALRTLADRFHGRPLAGILLLTDGNATDLHASPDIAGLPPVYPVVLGSPGSIKDLAIQSVHSTQTDFEDAPVSVQADVTANGYSGQNVVAEVCDLAGKKVSEQTLKARRDNDLLAFRFQLKPEKPGLCFYKVQVRSAAEPKTSANPGQSEEATLANNNAVVAVSRHHGPYRILYVSGRPTWEFKFLNRALDEDSELQLVGLIRIAKREPKFNFLGRSGETSNPLFRGFGTQSAEEVERYDQPVLIRLNTKDEIELRGGFPKTAEDLYSYHAVIVDHLESEFFTPDQSALLQKYVSERGAGFLMLGGMESFQDGNYQHTPIGDMLPVYLNRVEDTNPPVALRLDLTREGFLQSWARLRDNEADEKTRLQNMAPFQVLNRVREVKPGASVIATVKDTDGQAYPALVVQRFGRGRTGALTLGDFWHWGFHDADAHRDMDKAWRQLLRWLVNDVPNRVELTAEPQPNDPNGAIALKVRVRDPKFQPLDNASVSLEIQPLMLEPGTVGQTNSIRLQADPSSAEPGVYQASYVPRLTGGYQVIATVTNSNGAEVGHDTAGWSTDLAADEFRSLSPNVSLLEAIAHNTGGEIISAANLDAFAHNLPHRHAPIMEPWTRPFWHTPAMLGFALLCLVSEWGLRRWKGLP